MSAHTHTHRSARISSLAHTHTYRERQNSLGFFGCASSARRFPLLRWQWVEESTPSLPPFALRRLQRVLLHIVVYFGFFWPLQFVVAADAAGFFFLNFVLPPPFAQGLIVLVCVCGGSSSAGVAVAAAACSGVGNGISFFFFFARGSHTQTNTHIHARFTLLFFILFQRVVAAAATAADVAAAAAAFGFLRFQRCRSRILFYK